MRANITAHRTIWIYFKKWIQISFTAQASWWSCDLNWWYIGVTERHEPCSKREFPFIGHAADTHGSRTNEFWTCVVLWLCVEDGVSRRERREVGFEFPPGICWNSISWRMNGPGYCNSCGLLCIRIVLLLIWVGGCFFCVVLSCFDCDLVSPREMWQSSPHSIKCKYLIEHVF